MTKSEKNVLCIILKTESDFK